MEGKGGGQERRKSERLDVAFTLVYNQEKSHPSCTSIGLVNGVESLMVNLSDLGMAITTEHGIPLGMKLFIKFNLINLHLIGDERWRYVKTTGEVVSDVLLADSNHKIGIRFNKILEEDKVAIRDFVKCNKCPPLL